MAGYGQFHDQQSPMMGGGPGGGHPSGGPGYGGNPQFNTGPPMGGGYPQQQGQFMTQQPPYGGAPGAMPPRAMNVASTTSMNLVFFAAACCIMLNAFICGITLFFDGSLVDFMNLTYILLFGGILAVLDTPFFKTVKLCHDFKIYFGKYVNILTRVTGKGVTFIFLGCALLSAIDSNLSSVFLLFLGVILNIFVIGVGVLALVIGVMKSMKLKLCQGHLRNGTLEMEYPKYCETFRSHPQSGLTPAEFNRMTEMHGGLRWEEADLKLIFNAIVSNPSWRMSASSAQGQQGAQQEVAKVPLEDLKAWVYGGYVFL